MKHAVSTLSVGMKICHQKIDEEARISVFPHYIILLSVLLLKKLETWAVGRTPKKGTAT